MKSRNSALAAYYTELWALVDRFFSDNRWERIDEETLAEQGFNDAHERLISVVELGAEDAVTRELRRDLRITELLIESFLEWADGIGSRSGPKDEKIAIFWKYLQFMALSYAAGIEVETRELPVMLARRRKEIVEQRAQRGRDELRDLISTIGPEPSLAES